MQNTITPTTNNTIAAEFIGLTTAAQIWARLSIPKAFPNAETRPPQYRIGCMHVQKTITIMQTIQKRSLGDFVVRNLQANNACTTKKMHLSHESMYVHIEAHMIAGSTRTSQSPDFLTSHVSATHNATPKDMLDD